MVSQCLLPAPTGTRSFQEPDLNPHLPHFSVLVCTGSLLVHAGFGLAESGGSSLLRGTGFSHRGDFSCLEHRLPVAALGLGCSNSQAGGHGLSCYAACSIFLDQGSDLCPLHWPANSCPLYHQRSLPRFFISGWLGIWEHTFQSTFTSIVFYLKAGMAGQRETLPQSKKSVGRPFEPGTDPQGDLREAGWWFQE